MSRLINLPRWLLGYDGIPMMSRPTFRRELIGTFFASIGTGAMLPQLTQLFALKSLRGPTWVAALLVAEIAAGNFFGTFISQWLERRRRIPCVVAARLGIALVFAAIAFLPAEPVSIWPYVVLLMLAALLASSIMNVQASMRHSNYSQRIRGSVLGRLMIVRVAALLPTIKLASYVLDRWSEAHRLIYPVAAVAVAASAYAYSRIRVRREPRLISKRTASPIQLLAGFRLLVQDSHYGMYMLWQMLSGCMNLMVAPAAIVWLKEVMKASYTSGLDATALIPFAVTLLTLPLSGLLFDRMGVARFRGVSTVAWGISRALLWWAAVSRSWTLIYLTYAFHGLGLGGGMLAWNIGHTRFASPDKSQLYMGIHLTLQGIRGLTMPFLGVWLYGLEGVGVRLFAVSAAVTFVAAIGFFLAKLTKSEQAQDFNRRWPFGNRPVGL